MAKLIILVFSIVCATIVSGNGTRSLHHKRAVYNYGSIDTQINTDLTPHGTMLVVNSGPIDHEINIGSETPVQTPLLPLQKQAALISPAQGQDAKKSSAYLPVAPPSPTMIKDQNQQQAIKPKSNRFSANF